MHALLRASAYNSPTACFKVATGDVEDAPALDNLATFDLIEKDGAVYVKGEEETIKASRRYPNTKCSVQNQEKVVVVGGYATSISHQDRTDSVEQWKRCNRRGTSFTRAIIQRRHHNHLKRGQLAT